jgi:hypothetical protein
MGASGSFVGIGCGHSAAGHANPAGRVHSDAGRNINADYGELTILRACFIVIGRPFHIRGFGFALREADGGNDLRDHPTATYHVERFAPYNSVEVVRGAVSDLAQADLLPHLNISFSNTFSH